MLLLHLPLKPAPHSTQQAGRVLHVSPVINSLIGEAAQTVGILSRGVQHQVQVAEGNTVPGALLTTDV